MNGREISADRLPAEHCQRFACQEPVARLSRSPAALALATFLIVDVLIVVYLRTAGASLNSRQPIGGQLVMLALHTGLAWSIWRRSRVAWGILLALSGILDILILAGAGWPPSPFLLGFLALLAAQAMLLLSPAVTRHLRQSPGR